MTCFVLLLGAGTHRSCTSRAVISGQAREWRRRTALPVSKIKSVRNKRTGQPYPAPPPNPKRTERLRGCSNRRLAVVHGVLSSAEVVGEGDRACGPALALLQLAGDVLNGVAALLNRLGRKVKLEVLGPRDVLALDTLEILCEETVETETRSGVCFGSEGGWHEWARRWPAMSMRSVGSC